ncbi:MAG: diguanylate cyclase domain-containing protein [Clostridium sp.]|uniref:diguanylate cyclase domain-containing protein n=1 Tax=Clostridium sp. TaxID=1506 RepID=UPI003F40EF1A
MIKFIKGNKSYIGLKSLAIYILLSLLVLFLRINSITYLISFVINLSSMVTIIIFEIYGFKKGIISTVVTFLIATLFIDSNLMQLISLAEVIVISYFCIEKKKVNIIVGDLIYWIIISIPLFIIMSKLSYEFNLYFNVLVEILNSIFNIFIAELIVIYFIRNKFYKKDSTFKLRDLIIHILTAAMIIPFIINMSIDLYNGYEDIFNSNEITCNETSMYIKEEIKRWNDEKITNLQLSSLAEVGHLNDTMKKVSMYKDLNIYVTDKNNNIISYLQNIKINYEKGIEYRKRNVSDNLYTVVPIASNDVYSDDIWERSSLIYDTDLYEDKFKIYIETPMIVYKGKIIKEHLSQAKFFILFSLFIIVNAMIINKMILKSIVKLSRNTKNLPIKIESDAIIIWEDSKIDEINGLTENIKDMSINMKDIFTKLKISKGELYKLAYFDVLTNLPNRLSFTKCVESLISDKENTFAVMFLDLDKFKEVNDTLGHTVGDLLLKNVAIRLSDLALEDEVNVYRIGGDEFVLVCKNKDLSEIRSISNSIIGKFTDVFKINNHTINIKCSIGISRYPYDSEDFDDIVKYSDIAMYHSKENGGGYAEIFNENMKNNIKNMY